jgi:hypothetical protein
MSDLLVTEKERPRTVTVIVDPELREQLKRAARENDRSLGAEVRVALRRHLELGHDDEGGAR